MFIFAVVATTVVPHRCSQREPTCYLRDVEISCQRWEFERVTCAERDQMLRTSLNQSPLKLHNDQRNAQAFYLFIYLLLPYMFRAFFQPIFRGRCTISAVVQVSWLWC
jgi:hypothetical protein